jgi:hypothetical protein
MATNVGIDQLNKPAPAWYRRMTNAIIMFFIPGYVTVVQAVPMSEERRNILMCIATAVPFILKGVGMILGNGEYVKTDTEVKP